MTVYHCTNAEAAVSIQRDGFRDGSGSYTLEGLILTGVFVSNRPWDEIVGEADAPAVFAIELEEASITDFELLKMASRIANGACRPNF